MFISFEGGEGVGKTTLMERFYRELLSQGKKVLKTRAPGGTAVGNLIREIVLHKKSSFLSGHAELFLFLADRAQHVEEIIKPALASHTIVLCDRFNDSTVAYQGGARGFGEEWVRKLCAFATQELQPDLTFYLDLDPQEGLLRMRNRTKDRIEEESLKFHENIRRVYLQIAEKEPGRFHVLDASQSSEQVYVQAVALMTQRR